MFSLLQHSLWFIVRCLLLLVLVCPLHAGVDSDAGATSKPAEQAGIVAQKNGLTSHHLSSPASDHEGEKDDDPPSAKRTQSDPAAPIACSRCQYTFNEQELTRALRGSTVEPVACDACLYPASQTLPQETTGKRKATRKRTRPDPAAPQAKRSKSQAGKRKQTGNPQSEPAAKRVRLETRESTTDTDEALDILKQHLAFEIDEQETEAAKQLFECLKNKKLKVKKSLWKLLSKVDRKDFPAFCDKASVFFGALTSTITDTGCLTSMLTYCKKYIRDFAGRENSELEYLAKLDTLRTFSSMNNGKGFPKQADVEDLKRWKVWEVDGEFNMELLRAFSSMNSGKGLPKQADVEDVKCWKVWEVDGQFSMELFRAFSSMSNGKGLPKQADVEDLKHWKVWEVDGQFSMELFRTFSSMSNGKGLLKQADVEDVMGWKVWEVDGKFNMELLRAFSSMNSGKGLPKQADVEEVKRWKVWEVDGKFNMELFRTFSSMNSSRGLPKQADVKDVKSWKVWEVDGEFNMALLRAFSSMNHGKGLLKQADVEDVMRWKVWEVDGKFNMERLRAFSSMNHGKGLPKQADVEDVKCWKVWEVDGKFSMELLRAFSSMNNGKGLPKQTVVEGVKRWKVWEVDGKFSMELLRAISSMNHGKGLPKRADVEDLKRWKVWEVDGEFNMELLRAFSSMNNGKGLPKQAVVEGVKHWKVWEVDGKFSMELLRAFSSMNNGKGLPKQADVEEVKSWKIWEVDGKFSMELLRAFSSMNNGKGLPKQADVEDVKRWKVWDVDGKFNMELFRAFSSMNSSRGLPKEADVEDVKRWKVWEVDGEFSMALFRAFSSMNNGKGLPKEADVEDVKRWKVWEVDGKFSMELFRAFSSMNCKRGLPKEADVEDVKRWKVWEVDGKFSMELLRAFSSMNNGKGLPKQAEVEAVLAWLNCGGTLNDVLQSLMVRLYLSAGTPDTKKLKQYEQKLSALFFASSSTEPDSDDDEEEEQACLIKQVALFLLTRKPQYFLNLGDVEYFYQQVTGDADRRLEKLLRLLTSYGGAGVTRYLALNNNDRNALLSTCTCTCTSRIPLPLAMKAINEISPHERKRYLSFSKNLKASPDKTQWNDILRQLKRLTSVLKTPHAQRRYLEVVWSLAPSDRDIFLDETQVATVTAVFPSLNALKNLANRHSRRWLKELLEACLQYRQGTPSKESIKRLFTALLETQLPLYDYNDIPDYFLSGYTALGDSALFIRVTPPIQTAEELALHFVAAVMGVLSDMFYHYAANQLKIQQYGGGIHNFPVPELEIHNDGIEIRNWSAEVFSRFLAITEFPEHYYFSQEAWQQHCTPGLPGYFQCRMAACHQRESAAPDATTFHLSIPALMGLLKYNIRINPSAWNSFDYHKDRLPRVVHRRLLSEIKRTVHEDIPVSLKEYFEARKPPEEACPQNEMNAPASPPPAIAVELLSEKEQFQRLWADLSGKTLMVVADMELLAGYKDYMTMEHIVSILKRADVGMEPYRFDELRQLLSEKKGRHLRRDPLLLNLSDEVANYLIEADI